MITLDELVGNDPKMRERLRKAEEAAAKVIHLDEVKAARASAAADGPVGGGSAEQAEESWKLELLAAVKQMNQTYFVAMLGGQAVICSRQHEPAIGRTRHVFSRAQDIKLRFANQHYQVGVSRRGYPIVKDLGTAWIEHWARRSYDSITLLPGRETPQGVYNMWLGWGVEPKAGEWPLIHEHLLDVICSGSEVHYRYLLKLLAYMVQHPDRQAEVAIVLRGKKGTGKGTVGRMLTRIFRDHSAQITQARHLTGNFNAHLADVLFLFVDEAFWGGDKQGEGVLKGLITEPTLMIEPKGVNAFPMPNRLKILIASNSDWVVPASADERRFFMLDVSEHRKGDKPYWDRVNAAIEGDELAAFLEYLLTLDLAGFDHRNPPHTAALNAQKLVGADSVTCFWYDCLREGAIVHAGDMHEEWPTTIPTQLLHIAYLNYAQRHGDRHPATDAAMTARLRELWHGCSVHRIQSRKPWTMPDGTEVSRPRHYQLDYLERHRTMFLAAMNIEPAEHEWPAAGAVQ